MNLQPIFSASCKQKALLLLALGVLVSVLVLLGQGISILTAAQSPKQRGLENKIPAHVPIRVKIKKEKEKSYKDLNNEKWVREFELEVTNTSDKPIYFLELWLIYPEIIEPNGHPVGVPLRYGRMDFVHPRTLANKDDVPIKPGETHSFTIPEKDQKGWYARKAIGYMSDPRKIVLQFIQLNFGDGTGFDTTEGLRYPYRR